VIFNNCLRPSDLRINHYDYDNSDVLLTYAHLLYVDHILIVVCHDHLVLLKLFGVECDTVSISFRRILRDVSKTEPPLLAVLSSRLPALHSGDNIHFRSTGGVTYHTAHRATPLLSTPTGDA